MTKFNLSLHPHGDAVTVTDGEHKGLTGKVVDWLHIGPRDVDTVHRIALDKPLATTAKQETPNPDGSKTVREEPVTLTHIDVPASKLS